MVIYKTILQIGLAATGALTFAEIAIAAQQFVPAAGYSGSTVRPALAIPPEADAPAMARLPDTALAKLFRVDPAYGRPASVKIVGAFTVSEPAGTHFVQAWSPGFLPLTLAFSDGRCFSLEADYVGGALSNGRLIKTSCDRHSVEWPSPPAPDRPLRLVGDPWPYAAWVDESAGVTTVTSPRFKTFTPLFTAQFAAVAKAAMNLPDAPVGDITLVGKIDGRLTVVTLEVNY